MAGHEGVGEQDFTIEELCLRNSTSKLVKFNTGISLICTAKNVNQSNAPVCVKTGILKQVIVSNSHFL